MLTVVEGPHASAINDLAREGRIRPIKFIAPDGVERDANSIWAAHDWLVSNGFMKPDQKPIIWIAV